MPVPYGSKLKGGLSMPMDQSVPIIRKKDPIIDPIPKYLENTSFLKLKQIDRKNIIRQKDQMDINRQIDKQVDTNQIDR